MVVSQKTYLELDDVVPSWIEAVVANFFRHPKNSGCTLVGRYVALVRTVINRMGRPWNSESPRPGYMLRSKTVTCRFASHIILADLGLAPLVLDLPG